MAKTLGQFKNTSNFGEISVIGKTTPQTIPSSRSTTTFFARGLFQCSEFLRQNHPIQTGADAASRITFLGRPLSLGVIVLRSFPPPADTVGSAVFIAIIALLNHWGSEKNSYIVRTSVMTLPSESRCKPFICQRKQFQTTAQLLYS